MILLALRSEEDGTQEAMQKLVLLRDRSAKNCGESRKIIRETLYHKERVKKLGRVKQVKSDLKSPRSGEGVRSKVSQGSLELKDVNSG